jgi:hypothetical protein
VARRSLPTNPFYPLLIVVSIVFTITAAAYVLMTVRAISPTGAVSSPHPLMDFLDQHGVRVLLLEVAALAIVSFLAMGTDSYWTQRAAKRREE